MNLQYIPPLNNRMRSKRLNCYGECIITSQELTGKKIICKTIILKKKAQVILSGKVMDLNGDSIEGVIIKVKKLDHNYTPCKTTNLGYTISKEDGAYCICLKKQSGVDYRLCMYPPLIRD